MGFGAELEILLFKNDYLFFEQSSVTLASDNPFNHT